MGIKLIIFDLDGVVVNTSKVHFDALNMALAEINPTFCVSTQEDAQYLGAKSTKDKLKIISDIKGLPVSFHQKILEGKKKYTLDIISSINPSTYFSIETKSTINRLKNDGYLVYLASNTNKEFIELVLSKIDVEFDNIYCNSDVCRTKPHPEIYLKSILHAGVNPDECVVIEDSITGQEAAIRSGSHLFAVERTADVLYDDIKSFIANVKHKCIKWHSRKLNIIIPMAGEGSRFKKQGWTTPKPLIEVNNLPMVAAVIKDLNVEATITFIIKEEHDQEYHLSSMLKLISPSCNIVKVNGKQSGAATTILEASNIFNNSNPMMVVNADQMWDWDSGAFYHSMSQLQIDGSVVVFEDKSRNPKWSFAKTDSAGYVLEVAEKNPISDLATAGIYYFSKGSDFVKYSQRMIDANDRVNNEFYVCPVYNYMIDDGKKISTFSVERFWPTGTPEELAFYLGNRINNV